MKLRALTSFLIAAMAVALTMPQIVQATGPTPTATPTPGYINPASVIRGEYTPVAATPGPNTIGTSMPVPLTPRRLEIQNNCSAIVTIQFNGAIASQFGYGFEIPATSTKVWVDRDGPVPTGPYSVITSSALCDPNAGTGLSILEK